MAKIMVQSFPYTPGPQWGHLSAFDPSRKTLKVGYQLAPNFPPLAEDLDFLKDVAVTLRDGVTIYTDIFLPPNSTKIPVIVAWSPYGKSAGANPARIGLYKLLGVNSRASGLEKFEGPDPAYWCRHGYAICSPDARGVAFSDGDSTLLGRQEGQDCYDLIEWLAEQEWCNGKVAMSGTSYLAAAQWFTAAEQPPHLAAISPTEGFNDVYRDLIAFGGMPDHGFAQLLAYNFVGKGKREDYVAEAKQRPLVDELWRDKAADLERITVPTYVVASYSNTLHTVGTFRGWRRISSEEKWLRIHNTQEWPDYYSEAATEDLRRFFDCYLLGADNGWKNTPAVRYSLLDLQGGDQVDLAATEFPPRGTTYQQLYLHGDTRTLSSTMAKDLSVGYDANGWASFVTRFKEKTTIIGYPKVSLWLEAEAAEDMDVFVVLQKLDRHGTHLQQFTVPNQSAIMHDLTERGASILRFKGSSGRLKISVRHPAPSSTDFIPEHSFDKVERLSKGEIVQVEIALSPVGLVIYPEEQLRLVISGQSLIGGMMPQVPTEYVPINKGRQIIHTGQSHQSLLQLPFLDK